MLRAGTWVETANAFAQLFAALGTFATAIVGLAPRLGNRALTACVYGVLGGGFLFFFVASGTAGNFVEGVRRTAIGFLYPNATFVTEF